MESRNGFKRRTYIKPSKQAAVRPDIYYFAIEGDSLTDRGWMYNEKFLGCIPMSKVSGIAGISPVGRFTNGYSWPDYIGAMFWAKSFIKELKSQGIPREDLADYLLNNDQKLRKIISSSFTFNDPKTIEFDGQRIVRSYAKGGLMAHDYTWEFTWNPKHFFSRLILPALEDMREKLLKDDKNSHFSRKHKAKTLVVEWSGANDLITVNAKPTQEEADKAVAARIENIESLIAKGYKHFIVLNLPDISLTPRYQARSVLEQNDAKQCSDYFNKELADKCRELQRAGVGCTIKIFDICKLFREIYADPEKYHLDKNKLRSPFIDSADFKVLHNKVSPATGYMFWDDVHPSADVHALLGEELYKLFFQLFGEYKLRPPHVMHNDADTTNLVKMFHAAYKKIKAPGPTLFSQSSIDEDIPHFDHQLTLEAIFRYALREQGSRARRVLTELGWLDMNGRVNLAIPGLKKAHDEALFSLESKQLRM